MIILGILFIVVGIFMILKRNDKNRLFDKLLKGKAPEYEETVGTVICDAYETRTTDDGPSTRLITPIVEYEVNGEKYEGQNEQLSPNGELPVGLKMKVWYRKDNPRMYVLQSEIEDYNSWWIYSIICFVIGFLLIFLKVF